MNTSVGMKTVIMLIALAQKMTLAMHGKVGMKMSDVQWSIFDYLRQPFKIEKTIRLLEIFAGYGSQSMALERLGAEFEHYRVVEFDKYAIASYNAVHGTEFPTMDVKDVHATDLGIVEKDKYTYLLTYSFPCGLPGTKIKVEDGYKDIENVRLGEKVLTHNNRYEKVVKTMTRKSPNYYNIKVLGYPKLQLTSEHPLYVLRDGKIQWVKVKNLTTSDKVCFNINTESTSTKCSNEILWLLGRYVADGHINKYSHNSVNFAIGESKEQEFLQHIPTELKERFKTFKKTGVWDYRIADTDLQELCAECGLGAINKRIPQWILDLPRYQAKHFLDGYLSGDGHIRKDRQGNQVQMFCTASKELFLGLQTLIMKVHGTVCSCYLRSDSRKATYHDTYNGQFSLSGKSNLQERIGNQIFTPIREIEFVNEQTDVYNFEVENDNSYTCENIVVHNCTDLSLAGRQAGMARNSGTRSGLLWEVERILNECRELGELPDILQMENVCEVHGYKNKEHFDEWCSFLESLGYSNYMQDMNAADYGTAQHRERSIMISLLGDYNFKFPEPIPLRKVMKDYLDDEVDERFYLKTKKAYDLILKLEKDGALPMVEKKKNMR